MKVQQHITIARLPLALLTLAATVATAEPAMLTPFAVGNVIDTVHWVMEAKQGELEARSRLRAQKEAFDLAEGLYQQNLRLIPSRAVSEEEFRASRARRDSAYWAISAIEAQIREHQVQQKMQTLRVVLFSGVKIPDLEELSNTYAEVWKARYEGAQASAKSAGADAEYRQFVYRMTLSLTGATAASERDLLEAKEKVRDASNAVAYWREREAETRCNWQEFVKIAANKAKLRADWPGPSKCEN